MYLFLYYVHIKYNQKNWTFSCYIFRVSTRLTINFVSNHTARYLRPVFSQLLIPVGQILVCDLPLDIKNLRERTRSLQRVETPLPTVWHLPGGLLTRITISETTHYILRYFTGSTFFSELLNCLSRALRVHCFQSFLCFTSHLCAWKVIVQLIKPFRWFYEKQSTWILHPFMQAIRICVPSVWRFFLSF